MFSHKDSFIFTAVQDYVFIEYYTYIYKYKYKLYSFVYVATPKGDIPKYMNHKKGCFFIIVNEENI